MSRFRFIVRIVLLIVFFDILFAPANIAVELMIANAQRAIRGGTTLT